MKKNPLALILVVVLIIIALGVVAFYFFRPDATYVYNGTDTENTQLTDEQVRAVLAELADNIVLPDEANPFVAVITDIDALVAEQAFYTGAENGDYLIIYPQAARAIIYSLKRDQVINVGPVEFDNSAQAETTIVDTPAVQDDIFADEEEAAIDAEE
jgi:flagellar biosynthesis/type III secretory pathway M-ring protein FliF/YscJ